MQKYFICIPGKFHDIDVIWTYTFPGLNFIVAKNYLKFWREEKNINNIFCVIAICVRTIELEYTGNSSNVD